MNFLDVNWLKSYIRCANNYSTVLTIVSLFYIYTYFSYPGTPGNTPLLHPLGWWGWFDQGHYLTSAVSLARFDFTPANHFYPPLYPLIGAIFSHWSSGHMFFIPNLIFLLWFVYVFIRVSEIYIPRWFAVLIVFSSLILNSKIFLNFAIPWTTTLSAALLSCGFIGLVWLHEIKTNKRKYISKIQVAFIAISLGLLAPTRPADTAIGGIIGISLLIEYFRLRKNDRHNLPSIRSFTLLSAAGLCLGPALYLAFNLLVFETPTGGYVEAAKANGFFAQDLPEKFFSIWIEGYTLYGEPHVGLIENYPWLLISLAGLIWASIQGDPMLKTIALATITIFTLYLPYGDLLPNGLWRFLNIHYFKWTIPYLALLGILIVRTTFISIYSKKLQIAPLILLSGIPIFITTLQIDIQKITIPHTLSEDNTSISMTLPKTRVDFIDIIGLSSGFNEVYFGKHNVELDQQPLIRINEYRLIPMDWGSRLLFIRPVSGSFLNVNFGEPMNRNFTRISTQSGNYHFSIGSPNIFRNKTNQSFSIINYSFGEIIDFSTKGNSHFYELAGWSGAEHWGRWSTNDEASIRLRLSDQAVHPLELHVLMGAFVTKNHHCQELSILANGTEISRSPLCVDKGDDQQKPRKFLIPQNLVGEDRFLYLQFITPNSISPDRLKISSDNRSLGVGISHLSIKPQIRESN